MKGKVQIKVQPSNSRIYPDSSYEDVGCVIDEDITDCDVILGVKQIPCEKLYPNKTYLFFSHTIKAQENNMEMLDHILKHNIRLIDYEKICDDNNNRLVAFGRFAGIAGSIDIMFGIGQFLLNKGYGTPFLNISQSFQYYNVEQAKASITKVGLEIERTGLNKDIVPFVFGVSGSGRCSNGALEILKLLPHSFVKPTELKNLIEKAKKNPKDHLKKIYIAQFTQEHLVRLKNDNSLKKVKLSEKFDKKHYYKNSEKYEGIFQREYLEYLSVFINCIYWDDRFPRLINEKYLNQRIKENNEISKLIAISDVTCDYKGSIDFLKKFTTIDRPFFVFNPSKMTIDDNFQDINYGILYDSIENMPSQFPLDASNHFSQELNNYIKEILESDPLSPFEYQ